MDKYPKSLYRLLRGASLSPYYIKRVSINKKITLNNIQNDDEWRVMNKMDINTLKYENIKSTQIESNCLMTSKDYKNINIIN